MNSNTFVCPNMVGVECQINPSGSSTLNSNTFPTQEQLNGRTIIGLEVYSNQDITVSPISGLPTATPALFQASFLSLYVASIRNERPAGLYYDNIPMARLRNVNNMYNAVSASITSNTSNFFRLYPTTIDWTKSKINIPQSVSISQTYSFFFTVYYLEIDQANNPAILKAYMPQ